MSGSKVARFQGSKVVLRPPFCSSLQEDRRCHESLVLAISGDDCKTLAKLNADLEPSNGVVNVMQ
jgi:hypothetical protein